jgi:hypothetical protein
MEDKQLTFRELWLAAHDKQLAKQQRRSEERPQQRAAKQQKGDAKLAAREGLTVEQVQQGRAVNSTRKRRVRLFIGW